MIDQLKYSALFGVGTIAKGSHHCKSPTQLIQHDLVQSQGSGSVK